MIKGIILAPFAGLAVFVLGQIILPFPLCIVLGLAAAAFIVHTTVLGEDIYFELDDNGLFRYFCRKKEKNTFELSKFHLGYFRKTEWGILGNNTIRLKLVNQEGEETEIDAGPLGTTQFYKMFEEIEKFAIKDTEVLEAAKK
jgi:hypothetical protein